MMNDYNPVVSIIMPVFNGESYIRKSIESIINQNYHNIELIVVDGESTDNTLTIINSYSEFIDLIISEPDNSMYDAINKGILRSTGSILAYLNCDDCYLPDTISTIVDMFNKKRFDLIYGNCIFIDSFDKELYRYKGIFIPFFLIKKFGRIPFAQQTSFWTRTLYDRVGGFNTTYKYSSDTDFFYNCLLNSVSTVYIDKYLAYFRQHSTSISNNYTDIMASEHLKIIKCHGISMGFAHNIIDFLIKFKNIFNIIRKNY